MISPTQICLILLAVAAGVFHTQIIAPNMASTKAPTRQWADGPLPLVATPIYETKKDDIFTKGATHMALLHNTILRGFNTIYLQAPHVKPADYADFIGYSLTWFKFVKSHHDDEEDQLFPKIEELVNKKGIWDGTHKEHESFLPGLAAYAEYLNTCSVNPSTFSGTKLIEIMDAFKDDFSNHFHNEIPTIQALGTTVDEIPPTVGPTFAAWGKNSIMKAGLTDVVPFLFMNFDRSDDFEGGMWKAWPPMPAPIRWGLTNLGGSWHWGWWKFASCDGSGLPRELYALGDKQ